MFPRKIQQTEKNSKTPNRYYKVTSDNIYKYLLCFEQFYDKFSDIEKKEILQSFVERVEIFEHKLPSGRLLKKIQFRFPVFYDDKEVIGLRWDNDLTVECITMLEKKN